MTAPGLERHSGFQPFGLWGLPIMKFNLTYEGSLPSAGTSLSL